MKNAQLFINKAKSILNNKFLKEIGYEISYIYPSFKYDKELIIDQTINEDTDLGRIYEKILDPEERKNYGQFYTNDSLVIEYILNNCNVLGGKIIEPSCGSGQFIVAVIKKIISDLKNKMSSTEILNYLSENIYGIDIDEQALEITEVNILSTILPLLIETAKINKGFKLKRFNLICKDFITDKDKDEASLILGNPPFVTLYGKRSRNMNEEKRAYYNTFEFVQNKKGNNKFNTSMFFIENGL